MRNHKTLTTLILTLVVGLSASARAQSPADADPYRDIQKSLGFVPGFFRAAPEEAVASWWDQIKGLQLSPKTALSVRVKELIGLGVSAQIPCRYCIYFHTEAARANGASEREVKEAVAMAATTRHWSTIANGNQLDLAEFRRDVDGILAYAGRKNNPAPMALAAVVDARTAYQDIERVLGRVPGFLRRYPTQSIAAAWKVLRSVQLNPATALSAKEKELIALGVASQIPCSYCTYFHTRAAKAFGASDQEIQEAVGMAAITRFGSTILNGGQVDEASFKKDVDRIFSKGRKTASR